MSGKMSRNKGARGEREFIKILQAVVSDVCEEDAPQLKRNLFQPMEGGMDVAGLHGIALEVKFQERLNVKQWWEQTVSQKTRDDQVAVLAYRQSRRPWRIMIEGAIMRPICIHCPVEVTLEDFLKWFRYFVERQCEED